MTVVFCEAVVELRDDLPFAVAGVSLVDDLGDVSVFEGAGAGFVFAAERQGRDVQGAPDEGHVPVVDVAEVIDVADVVRSVEVLGEDSFGNGFEIGVLLQDGFGGHAAVEEVVEEAAHVSGLILDLGGGEVAAEAAIAAMVFGHVFGEGADDRAVDDDASDGFALRDHRADPAAGAVAKKVDLIAVDEGVGLQFLDGVGEVLDFFLQREVVAVRAGTVADTTLFAAHDSKPGASEAVDEVARMVGKGERKGRFDGGAVDALDIEDGRELFGSEFARMGDDGAEFLFAGVDVAVAEDNVVGFFAGPTFESDVYGKQLVFA